MTAGLAIPPAPPGLTFVAGSADLEALARHHCPGPFSNDVTMFLNAFSTALLRAPPLRAFPEMIAFAYWIRSSQVKKLQGEFNTKSSSGLLVARGTVFHVAPANVDTIFLYSLVLSMLAGNNNIVRVSSRDSAQVSAVLDVMRDLLRLPAHQSLRESLSVLRYERSSQITAHLSALCDMRVIWGGDASVSAIRALPLPPHATELCFPDKVSIAVIDCARYLDLSAEDREALAGKFSNDTYTFGQMACSSPHLVAWRGGADAFNAAQAAFWTALDDHIAMSPLEVSVIEAMNKLVGEQRLAAKVTLSIRPQRTNQLSVNSLVTISDFDPASRCGGGFFSQAPIASLDGLLPLVTRRMQTVASFGISQAEWADWVALRRPRGLDRIVSVGKALDFAAVWDGFDLMRQFTREISIGAQ